MKLPIGLIKGAAIALVVAALSSGIFFTYKWAVHKSDTQLAAAVANAHAAGVAETNAATTEKGNTLLLEAIQNLQVMQAETNEKMSNIRMAAQQQNRDIYDYDAETIAAEHPETEQVMGNGDEQAAMKQVFAGILIALALSACSTPTKPDNFTVIAPTPPVTAPKADPVVPAPVQWKVYTLDELKALVAERSSVLLFTLDEKNFKNLSGNLVDIKKYIDQQNEIIAYLTKAANAPSDAAKAANEKK